MRMPNYSITSLVMNTDVNQKNKCNANFTKKLSQEKSEKM
jgi:hypothetical protein